MPMMNKKIQAKTVSSCIRVFPNDVAEKLEAIRTIARKIAPAA